MPKEVVYVLGAPGSNTVKIGRTTNLAKRLADIQRMSPVPLAVLWSHPGGHELETTLHRHFAGYRSHGEWFAFRINAVRLIQWAVEDEPWNQKKISLKKAKVKARPATLVPPPRAPLSERNPALHAALDEWVAELLRPVEAITDPAERYRETLRVDAWAKKFFSEMRQEAVLKLKQEGRTWREVGDLLGVTGARAEQMSRRAR